VELKAGYKSTEVGLIPEGWDFQPLEHITDPQRPIGYGIVQTGKLVRNGVKCIRVVDIVNGGIDSENLITTTEQISQAYKRTLLREGDLVLALRGRIGAVAVINLALAGTNLTRGVALLSSSEVFDSNYLSQYLASPFGKETFERNLNGSALQEIPIASLRKMHVVVPPLFEQRAIASALSDVDTLLARLDQLITKKRDLKLATTQQLLTGQTRLPGFSGDWVEQSIASFSAFVSKGSTPTTYGFKWVNSGILFLRSECVSANGLDLSQSMFISESAHACLSRGEVVAGDILITITGNVGRVVQLGTDFSVGNTNQHIARIRVKDPKVSSAFVFHWLSQKTVRAVFEKNTTGQAYPQISLKQVRETQIPLPSRDEQTAIATVLSDMDAELAALEARREKTRALKQGMMQELLTGRIRLV